MGTMVCSLLWVMQYIYIYIYIYIIIIIIIIINRMTMRQRAGARHHNSKSSAAGPCAPLHFLTASPRESPNIVFGR